MIDGRERATHRRMAGSTLDRIHTVLDVTDVRHRYGSTPALDGVTLHVDAGECVALLGPNGAGKTTLVRSILGLIAPDSGSISVCGGDPVKRVSGTSVSVTLIAKVLAAVPYALAVLGVMIGTAAAFGRLSASWWTVLSVALTLVLGALPFVFFGLAVGSLAGANTTTAILNAVLFPMIIASGLWFPLEIMPSWIQGGAPILPTYHLAGLAGSVIDGGPWATHFGVLALTGSVGALVAGWAYRTVRP